MVIFHSYVNVDQRVPPPQEIPTFIRHHPGPCRVVRCQGCRGRGRQEKELRAVVALKPRANGGFHGITPIYGWFLEIGVPPNQDFLL